MTLRQPHTRTELGGGIIVTSPKADVPCPVRLIDALAVMTEGRQQGIQTGLGSVGLPTTIEQFHGVIRDLSDEVAMEVHGGNLTLALVVVEVDHLGVGILPILARLDGAVHQGFDLTHGRCRLFDFYRIQEKGVITTPCVPVR